MSAEMQFPTTDHPETLACVPRVEPLWGLVQDFAPPPRMAGAQPHVILPAGASYPDQPRYSVSAIYDSS